MECKLLRIYFKLNSSVSVLSMTCRGCILDTLLFLYVSYPEVWFLVIGADSTTVVSLWTAVIGNARDNIPQHRSLDVKPRMSWCAVVIYVFLRELEWWERRNMFLCLILARSPRECGKQSFFSGEFISQDLVCPLCYHEAAALRVYYRHVLG